MADYSYDVKILDFPNSTVSYNTMTREQRNEDLLYLCEAIADIFGYSINEEDVDTESYQYSDIYYLVDSSNTPKLTVRWSNTTQMNVFICCKNKVYTTSDTYYYITRTRTSQYYGIKYIKTETCSVMYAHYESTSNDSNSIRYNALAMNTLELFSSRYGNSSLVFKYCSNYLYWINDSGSLRTMTISDYRIDHLSLICDCVNHKCVTPCYTYDSMTKLIYKLEGVYILLDALGSYSEGQKLSINNDNYLVVISTNSSYVTFIIKLTKKE